MKTQLVLFEIERVERDGMLLVKPKRIVDGVEISTQQAMKLLKFTQIETISALIRAGEIKAWKPKSVRGNAKWRIDQGSVLDYKMRRMKAAVA